MKKIIWFFGESATGKLTLINNLVNGNADVLDYFNMTDKKITVSDITLEDRHVSGSLVDSNYYDDSQMEDDGPFFSKKGAVIRRAHIMNDADTFMNSDDDILLIKGQANDLNYKRGNIVGNFLNKYSNLEDVDIEVFFLEVTDELELKHRIATKPWFKALTDEAEKKRLLDMIPLNQEKHKAEVIDAFSDYNVQICCIESLTNSYRLNEIIDNKKELI